MEKHPKPIYVGGDKAGAGVLGTGRSREIHSVIGLSDFPLVQMAWTGRTCSLGSIFSSHVG